jgi:hypothetical protein
MTDKTTRLPEAVGLLKVTGRVETGVPRLAPLNWTKAGVVAVVLFRKLPAVAAIPSRASEMTGAPRSPEEIVKSTVKPSGSIETKDAFRVTVRKSSTP